MNRVGYWFTIWDELGYIPVGSGGSRGGLASLGQILVSLPYLYYLPPNYWAHIKMHRVGYRFTIWDKLGYRPVGSGGSRGGLASLGQILVSLPYLYYLPPNYWAHIKMHRVGYRFTIWDKLGYIPVGSGGNRGGLASLGQILGYWAHIKMHGVGYRFTIWDKLGYIPVGSGGSRGGLASLGQILVSLPYLYYLPPNYWAQD